MGFYILT